MLALAAIGGAIALIFVAVTMGSGLGKTVYAYLERFPKVLAFLSGAIVGALFGLIPGASLGWLMGSRIAGAIVCLLCAAGAGYAWMRFEMRPTKPEPKRR